jgi:hypothetical protein
VNTTIEVKSKGMDQKKAFEIARDAFAEVRKVYEKTRKTLSPKN